jgi:hypothetical protein
MNNPSFIGIGVGRCGTTNLYVTLINASNKLKGATKKELGFFGGENYKKGLMWYKRQFPSDCYTGEATPWYFYRKGSAKTIKKHYPNTMLILMLRNPIDRIYSFFMLLWAVDRVKTNNFEKLLKTSEGERLIREGKYINYLKNWEDFNNLLIIRSEDYWLDPKKYILKIYKKLGIDEKIRDDFVYKNYHRGSYKEWHPKGDIFHKKGHAERIKERKNQAFPPVKMDPKTRAMFLKLYRKPNELLYEKTGIKWSEWD